MKIALLALMLLASTFHAQTYQTRSTVSVAPPMTLEEINTRLRGDDQPLIGISEKLLLLDFQLKFAICEHTWHHTPIWTKVGKYHMHDPCKRAVKAALRQLP